MWNRNLIKKQLILKVKDPEDVVIKLIEKLAGKIEKYYNVDIIDDPEETLEIIAINKNVLKKGGLADTVRMSRMILYDWQKGKIKIT